MNIQRRIGAMHGVVATTGGLAGQGITVNDVLSLFNIFVGLMVVTAVLLFVGGLIAWAARLGTVGRVQGIRLMEWGVVILFVLTVLLPIIQYFVGHPAATTMAVSVIVVIVIGYIVLEVIKSSGGKESARPAPER
jgi:hypothetical protein